MSTIRANTLTDAAGNNSSTAAQIQQGRAKAWSILNGTGTIAERDSFNIASHTDNGTGDYTFTLSAAQPSVNWSGTFQANGQTGSSVIPYPNSNGSYSYTPPTVTAFRGYLTTGAFSATDREHVQFIANGD